MTRESTSRDDVYAAIMSERIHQEKRIAESYNPRDTEEFLDNHQVGDYLSFIRDYQRQADNDNCRIWGVERIETVLTSIRKIGALAFACMEQHGAVPRFDAPAEALSSCDFLTVKDVVDQERQYQDELPEDRTDGLFRSLGDYLTMLDTYVRKAADAWTNNAGVFEALEVVRKIAGICVHCMEDHGAPLREH